MNKTGYTITDSSEKTLKEIQEATGATPPSVYHAMSMHPQDVLQGLHGKDIQGCKKEMEIRHGRVSCSPEENGLPEANTPGQTVFRPANENSPISWSFRNLKINSKPRKRPYEGCCATPRTFPV